MRITKTLSISLPPKQLQQMERTAKKENRTMSELVHELYRRYMADEARREFASSLEESRAEATGKPANTLPLLQIDTEIGAAR